MLTGQYAHNNNIWSNTNGYGTFRHDQSLGFWLHDAGYTTANVGKYLNGYASTSVPQVPPGWDEWFTPYGDEDKAKILWQNCARLYNLAGA